MRNRDNRPLYVAIRDYGKENFSVEDLHYSSGIDEALKLEYFSIIEHGTRKNGYNVCIGGSGPLECSESSRQKQVGKVITAEQRHKMSLAKLGDKTCAAHFGDHTKKGGENPRAAMYRVRLPDGTIEIVRGKRAFCREHGLPSGGCFKAGKTVRGYEVLEKIDGYPFGEYAQAGGSGGHPTGVEK
jgi:hypothetical protein